MAKKEKEIELKAKADKISKEHLEELQKLVNSSNAMNFNLGRIEVTKHETLHKIANVKDQIALFQDTLMKEYGTFDVNLDDGTINWPEEKEKSKDEK